MARLGTIVTATALASVLVAACGRSELRTTDATAAEQSACGDRTCANGETCVSCPVDCGPCPGCGDGTCSPEETCASCPRDCNVCETCGDGFCKGTETCLSCAPDCGKCEGCGDGTCDARTEDCFSCPEDCGKCKECGDGTCGTSETCASCAHDCGVCAVCGNAKCEGPYETCSNCHDDCGDCETIGCLSMLTCSFKCFDASKRPPDIQISCIADCVAVGCPSARFLFDQAFNCFIQHLDDCGANFSCLSKACDAEVGACTRATCAK